MDLDLNLVAVFTRVIDIGTFTGAATALGIPKSSVSRAVSRLEESLGVRLLQRTTRSLGLTEAGERFVAEVRGPMARLAEATAEISDLGTEPRGLVRISIAPESTDGPVSPLLVAFVHRYPKVRIDLVVTSRRVNLIAESIDLALRAGRLDDSTLVARKIASVELELYAAPAYLERRGIPRRFSDLLAHDCVLHRTSQGTTPWRLSGPRGIEHVTVDGPVTADDLGSVRSLTIAGLGIALLPHITVHADVKAGLLVRVLPAYSLPGSPLSLVSAPLRHVPARVTLLRDFLVTELASYVAGAPCAIDAHATPNVSAPRARRRAGPRNGNPATAKGTAKGKTTVGAGASPRGGAKPRSRAKATAAKSAATVVAASASASPSSPAGE